MIITREELALIQGRPHGRQARRMMRLPVTYDQEAIKRRCPMRTGRSYLLQTRLADGGSSVYVLVTATREERLGGLTEQDARREGYANRTAALDAYRHTQGAFVVYNGKVWVISFTPVEHPVTATDTPVFLSKVGDYTTMRGRQAVPGDPEVMRVDDTVGEQARIVAIAQRQAPHHNAVSRAAGELETLRESLISMKARNRAALISKELNKLAHELSAGDMILSDAG